MQNCPKIKQHYKDKDNFRNCKFFFTFSSFFILSIGQSVREKACFIGNIYYLCYAKI